MNVCPTPPPTAARCFAPRSPCCPAPPRLERAAPDAIGGRPAGPVRCGDYWFRFGRARLPGGRQGFKALVLEQHDKPGGYATAFRRLGGFAFDVSLAHSRRSATRPERSTDEPAGPAEVAHGAAPLVQPGQYVEYLGSRRRHEFRHRHSRARTPHRLHRDSSFSAISSNFRTVFQLRLVPGVLSVFSSRGIDNLGRAMPLG